jgi:hypothetical protein
MADPCWMDTTIIVLELYIRTLPKILTGYVNCCINYFQYNICVMIQIVIADDHQMIREA